MDERELRTLIDEVKSGRLSRRRFVQTMVGLGLTAPMAAQMLTSAGRGAGPVEARLQADQAGRRRHAEDALVAGRHPAEPALRHRHQGPGRLPHLLRAAGLVGPRRQPHRRSLAAEIPSLQNGGLAKDGKSVTWKLKKGVVWHDGKPFTADDCVFTWEYVADPATASPSHRPATRTSQVDKVDSHTVKVDLQEADAVLGGRLLRRARHDPSQAPLRGLQGRQVARGADQPQAGRHRALPLRGLQARRHRPRRAEPELPHAQPAVLRHHRDEGRRRRRLGRARGHPDRRVRLRLEHAGRGRDPQAHGAGRQGQGRHRVRAATSSTSSSTSPIRGPRSTASARRQDQASVC